MCCGAPVDCEAGRRLGCRTFCCRLLVRLDPDEREPSAETGTTVKGFVDKTADGICLHFDPETSLCRIWERRPRVCREYDCNGDFLLQVVLREGFTSIAALAKAAARAYIPRETFIRVPHRSDT
ncbi:MAG: hypothetical protein GWO02_12685 [Gammaproteobacteria bacterium]|nr:hypothetical protein [Gammaproteobacteria bacterium]